MAVAARQGRQGGAGALLGPGGRRSLPLALVALLVAAGCAGGFALLLTAAAARRPVLAAAETVLAGQVIEASDLAVVNVSADAPLPLIGASEIDRVVGMAAASDLVAGGLLTEGQLGAAELVGPGQALVGAALRGGQLPAGRLRPGEYVQVVATPPQAGPAGGPLAGRVLASGRVFAVSEQPDAAGALLVSLAVDRAAAPLVAGAAAAGQVSLIVVPGR